MLLDTWHRSIKGIRNQGTSKEEEQRSEHPPNPLPIERKYPSLRYSGVRQDFEMGSTVVPMI
jgi:hypothetical protein